MVKNDTDQNGRTLRDTGPRGGTTTRYASGKKRTNVVLPNTLADRLERQATELHESQSAIIREALTEYLRLMGYIEDPEKEQVKKADTRTKNIMLSAQLAQLLERMAVDTQQTHSDIIVRALSLHLRLTQEDPDTSSSK